MSKSNYEMLVEQYKFKDEDALREITVKNGYTDEAEQAAKDVLASDRKEYHELKKREEDREIFEEKLSQDRFSNPLYEDIHQIRLLLTPLTCPHFRLTKGDPYEKSNYNSNTNNDRIQCGPTGNPGTSICCI